MALSGPLDRGVALKLAATLNPLLQSVSGPVVQVGRPLNLTYPPTASVSVCKQLPTGELETIVFVAELCQPHWTQAALAKLVERLTPNGRVLFAEPVCGTGLASQAQRLLAPLTNKRWGYTFTRDIPADLRLAGMTVTSVNRVFVEPVPTLFTYAAGDARFY